jgi:hypothetical protein
LAHSATTEDSGAVFDAHVRAEFVERSVDATMATMTDAPYVTHVPVLTGGYGRDEVRHFYATWFRHRIRRHGSGGRELDRIELTTKPRRRA